MAVLAAVVMPVCGKGDVSVLGLALDQLGLMYFKPKPGTAQTPGLDGVLVEAGLLGPQCTAH